MFPTLSGSEIYMLCHVFDRIYVVRDQEMIPIQEGEEEEEDESPSIEQLRQAFQFLRFLTICPKLNDDFQGTTSCRWWQGWNSAQTGASES